MPWKPYPIVIAATQYLDQGHEGGGDDESDADHDDDDNYEEKVPKKKKQTSSQAPSIPDICPFFYTSRF